MRVMQILPRMDVGGVERGVWDAAKYFKTKASTIESDAAIINVVVSAGGRLVRELEAAGVKHYRLNVQQKSPVLLLQVSKLRKIIRSERIDIIHARSRMPGWAAFLASRGTPAHFITTAHGIYRRHFFSEVMGWGKFVICPSKVVARHMKDNFGVPEDKIKLISRWVNPDAFKFTAYPVRKHNHYIVSIGRISPSKGYEYLIEGFKKVVRFNPYLKLRIVGAANRSKQRYLEHLKTLVTRFSLNYNVEFSGFQEDVEKILEDARILVAPSVIEESFGRVVVEAFACGVPVVATAVGGFKEIITDGENGILVEPKNSTQIADNILRILNDSALAEKLTQRARQKVEQDYVMEKCLEDTALVYDQTQKTSRILVIKISSLGDLILVIPTLKALRDKFPQSQICLLTLKKYSVLFYDCPYVDEVITVGDTSKGLRQVLSTASILRRRTFDYIVDLQNSRFSHLVSGLSLPRYSFGYARRWGFLLTKSIKPIPNDSPLKSQERVIELLGVKLDTKRLIFWPKRSETTLLLPEGKFIGINVAASRKWRSKNWPFKNILKLIELIQKNWPDFRVVLFGDESSQGYGRKIEQSAWPHPFNLCGKTALANLPQALERMSVFVTPDTATLHLSCALGIPTIGLFGPTDPETHTVQNKNLHIFCKKMPCSFCYRHKCSLQDENTCLRKISAQEVFTKIREILKQ